MTGRSAMKKKKKSLFIVSANNLASDQVKYLINKRGTITTPCKRSRIRSHRRPSGNESTHSGPDPMFERVCVSVCVSVCCVLLLPAVAHVADKCQVF